MGPFLTVLVLATVVLAGCAAKDPATASLAGPAITHLRVDFHGAKPTLDVDLAFDASARPAQALYAAANATHPAFYNALDQLAAWRAAGGKAFDAKPSDYGFFLTTIDGYSGASAAEYWSLAVNGKTSETGLDLTPLHAGDVVSWTITTYVASPPSTAADAASSDGAGKPSAAPARPPTLTMDAVPATRTGSVVLAGNVSAGAKVSLTVVHGASSSPLAATVMGDHWMVEAKLAPGKYMVSATADNGAGLAKANRTVESLTSATMQVKYTAYPVHANSDDTVWYDPDVFTSAASYEGKDTKHPDAFSLHDLMASWTAQTGTVVTYDYFSGLGYSPSKFDGIGQPVSAAAPPYWCYKLNGASSNLGITLQAIKPDDLVVWEYAGCA